MSQVLPKIAVATFLKNEYSDIAGWISWHLALGVDTLFIYDDHSTDGTWEIIKAASQVFDIKIFRTNLDSQPDFYLRQRDSFMAAADMCRGTYDWLGFLDGDEYLYMKHADTLPEFFSNFEHADGVAFSWRIHGSSNRVIRPKITTVEAFPFHSSRDLGDNTLVKSFVRPDKMGTNYHTPHWFDVPASKYVRPDGRPVVNESPCQDIEWSDAFVMHYICRSMEHYVERIKRRLNADLSDSQGYWDHFNRNDMEDREPFRFLDKTNLTLAHINHALLKNLVRQISSELSSKNFNRSTHERIFEEPLLFEMQTFFGTKVCFSPKSHKVVHAEVGKNIESNDFCIKGAVYPSTPNMITLFLENINNVTPMLINGDSRVLNTYIYEVVKTDDGDVFLKNPQSNMYLSFSLNAAEAECNRHVADDWERIKLIPIENKIKNHSELEAPTSKTFGALLERIEHEISVSNFLRMYYRLTPLEKEFFTKCYPGILWSFS